MERVNYLNFVIGPKDHGYYKMKHVKSAEYEKEATDLYHPDIGTDFEPGENECSLRPFY